MDQRQQSLTPGERSVLGIISRSGGGGRALAARRLGTSTAHAEGQIRALVRKGWLEPVGGGLYVPCSEEDRNRRLFLSPEDIPTPPAAEEDDSPSGQGSDSASAEDNGLVGWLADMVPRLDASKPSASRANAATVRKRAKKAIAVEWAKARGARLGSANDRALEWEAARWRQEEEQRRAEAEEAEARLKRFRKAVLTSLGEVEAGSCAVQPAELLEPIAWIHGEVAAKGGGTCFFVEPRDRHRFRKPPRPSVLYRLELDRRFRLIAITPSSSEELADAKGE